MTLIHFYSDNYAVHLHSVLTQDLCKLHNWFGILLYTAKEQQ